MDKPNLEQLRDELQAELRLKDWRIEVTYVRDLQTRDGRAANGLCSHLVDAKVARIAIRDPETPASSADPSVEETLIHELLHLHFAPLSGSSAAEIAVEEQAVWAITEAISTAKDAARRGQIARAMVAHSAARTRRSQPITREKTTMDPATIAALRALLNTDDVGAALKTFLDSMEGAGAGDGGGDAPPPAAQEAPPAPPAEEEQPKAQRPIPVAPKGRAAGVVPLSAAVGRSEFDRFKVDTLLDNAGKHLSEGKRAFAATLTYEQARAFLATESAEPTVERRSSPTVGARAMTAADAELAYIDRRMGVARGPTNAVSIDPVTHRLSISALAPVRIQEARGAGEGK